MAAQIRTGAGASWGASGLGAPPAQRMQGAAPIHVRNSVTYIAMNGRHFSILPNREFYTINSGFSDQRNAAFGSDLCAFCRELHRSDYNLTQMNTVCDRFIVSLILLHNALHHPDTVIIQNSPAAELACLLDENLMLFALNGHASGLGVVHNPLYVALHYAIERFFTPTHANDNVIHRVLCNARDFLVKPVMQPPVVQYGVSPRSAVAVPLAATIPTQLAWADPRVQGEQPIQAALPQTLFPTPTRPAVRPIPVSAPESCFPSTGFQGERRIQILERGPSAFSSLRLRTTTQPEAASLEIPAASSYRWDRMNLADILRVMLQREREQGSVTVLDRTGFGRAEKDCQIVLAGLQQSMESKPLSTRLTSDVWGDVVLKSALEQVLDYGKRIVPLSAEMQENGFNLQSQQRLDFLFAGQLLIHFKAQLQEASDSNQLMGRDPAPVVAHLDALIKEFRAVPDWAKR
ncbi:MAG: hypothetical protein O3A01_05385 [bacterium]|nr:hypothetical protein [bacterium]